MNYHILVTARSFANTPGAHHDLLREAGCIVDLKPPAYPYTATQLCEMVAGYDGIIAGLDAFDASVIERADRLKVISRYGVGVDAVDVQAAARQGIAVTNTPGANMLAVSELTLGLLFALARQIPQVAAAAKAGEWQRPTGWELSGKTLGVVGFGAIGRDVGRKAVALGMKVLAHDPFSKDEITGVRLVDLNTLLTQADIVTLHSTLTPDTANLINAERIALMKDGAYLINTARGELVDEEALYAALQSGKLGGAAIDAFRREPPVGSPLLTLDNVIAIPHLGATTRESVERMALMASQNLLKVLRGEGCDNVVNGNLLTVNGESQNS
jgi:D-3-phosphoglycerate dehydrogenase / 2-oxoglutarate reductase